MNDENQNEEVDVTANTEPVETEPAEATEPVEADNQPEKEKEVKIVSYQAYPKSAVCEVEEEEKETEHPHVVVKSQDGGVNKLTKDEFETNYTIVR